MGTKQPPQSSPSPTIEGSATSTEEKKEGNSTNARDPNLVDWEPNDKDNPRNWSVGFKIWCTFQLSNVGIRSEFGIEYHRTGWTCAISA
jgi:hypothetical protein